MRTWPSEWRTASTWSRGGRRRVMLHVSVGAANAVCALLNAAPRAGAHPVHRRRTRCSRRAGLGSRTHARALIRPRMLKRCKPRVRRCALVHSMLAGSLLVDLLCLVGAHALAPLPNALLSVGSAPADRAACPWCDTGANTWVARAVKLLDLIVLGKAPVGQPLLGHPSVASWCCSCMGSI